MIIAVDAAGGDYAPHEIVKGAIKASQEHGVEIALVGRRSILHVLLGGAKGKPGIKIVEARQTIGPHESPMKAARSKPHSSIVVGINMVKEGKASAFVSAGNTGAVLCAALLNLGKIAGVERPAIGCFLNTILPSPTLLVDAGANADCRPKHLLQFAQLGSICSKNIFDIDSPRIGLLNNGEEEGKGNSLTQESYQLIASDKNLNFIGNIEGQDVLRGTAHVIVTDGFTGNIVIKSIEGICDTFLNSARQMGHIFSSLSHLRGRNLLSDIGLRSLAKKMDYTEYGGACLLGIEGNVIIAHGRSQAKAINNAIGLAKETTEREMVRKIKEGIYEQNNQH